MNTGAIAGMAIAFLSIVGFLAFPLLLYFFIKRYRDTRNLGVMNFKEAYQIGAGISFFASIIVGFFAVIMVVFIGLPEETLDMYKQFYGEEQLDLMKSSLTPMNLMISAVLMFTFIGYILSLIIAVFVKQENIDANAE